jgi:two-component system, cell cycle sensor histidine kinase and response regulator CckA
LAFSRGQVRETETLNLQTVIAEVKTILQRMIGEDIELITRFHEGSALVRADRSELTHILLNLAANSRDAMPNGGTLTFTVATVEVTEDDLRADPSARTGSHVLLTVSDTGSGMDAEIQKHLFEPFFTTKKAGKGTGLGLAMVYGIVAQRGGWIQVNSKLRGGTTVHIYLPCVEGQALEKRVQAESPGGPILGSETILVVEDQTDVRKLTCAILREFGYQALEASNGEEALHLLSTYDGPLDLLLTDVIMPGIHGPELADRLRTIRPTPVLFMSGYSGGLETRRGSEAASIQKPFTPVSLAQKVREVLGAPKAAGDRGDSTSA